MSSLSNIVDHINLDNKNSEKVFHDLAIILKSSYKEYPIHINLVAIFFIDLLKLITHLQLKFREIDNKVNLREFSSSKLQRYPYFGYSDLINGLNLEEKKYGKDTNLGFSDRGKISKKYTYIYLTNIAKRIFKQKSRKLVFSGESSLSTKKHIDIITSYADLTVLNISHPWFYAPKIDGQLDFLKRQLEVMLPSYFKDALIIKQIIKICLNHIRASISNVDNTPSLKADFLILGSGHELENRMIASIAKRQNIPVINVMHGEAYGIYDEPGFGRFGEQIFSDYMLGYGAAALEKGSHFRFEQNTKLKYIESNADSIINTYRGPRINKPSCKKIDYYYFPTSYRGSQHRFGPFQDLPDKFYIDWQNILAELFKDKLKMKLHPKEKYSFLCDQIKMEKIKKKYGEISNKVDVFVFDYIGSAFNQACATTKPVVYFDLGIRNISAHAMNKIKQRTIYFDLRNEEIPSFKQIEDRIFQSENINMLTENYSLTSNKKSRSESLLDAIEI